MSWLKKQFVAKLIIFNPMIACMIEAPVCALLGIEIEDDVADVCTLRISVFEWI